MPKKPIIHQWRIETSAFGQPVITGRLAKTGEWRTMGLLWWSDGKFGTEDGVFTQGFESHTGNAGLEQ